MAVIVSVKAKYWCCCDKRLYVRQCRAEYSVASTEDQITRWGLFSLSFSLSLCLSTNLHSYSVSCLCSTRYALFLCKWHTILTE